MNEQLIKSLMSKASTTRYSGMGDTEILDPVKFAKLIVKECISTLEKKIYSSIDGDGDEIWADLILKEHFGVD